MMKFYRLTGLFLFAAFALACDGEALDSDETYAEDRGPSESADDSSEATGTESDSTANSDASLEEDSPEKGQSGDDGGDNAQDQSEDEGASKDSDDQGASKDSEGEDEIDDSSVLVDDSDPVVCLALECEKEELCDGEKKPEADCKPGYECINQGWSCIDDGKVCPKPGSQKEVFEGP